MKKNRLAAFLVIFIFSSCTYHVHIDTRQYRKGFYITVSSIKNNKNSSSLKSLPAKKDRNICLKEDSLMILLMPVSLTNKIEKELKISFSEKTPENVKKNCPHDTIIPKSINPKRRVDWMGLMAISYAAIAATVHVGTGLPTVGIVIIWLLFLALTFIFAGISLGKIKKYPKDFKWKFIAIVAMSVAGISFVIALLSLLGIWPGVIYWMI